MGTEPANTAETKPAANPLSKFFRIPAIYLTLPSGGKYWEPGSIEFPDSGELAVFPRSEEHTSELQSTLESRMPSSA
mgnify:CR=1 FL=1